MTDDEEYELMPHQTISRLKRELQVLKKKVGSKENLSSKEVQKNIEKLNENINNLLSLFQEAAKGMKTEEAEPGIKEQIEPLMKRLEKLEDENKKIAEGILVVADLVKSVKKEEKKLEESIPKIIQKPQPASRPMPKPVMRQMPLQQTNHMQPQKPAASGLSDQKSMMSPQAHPKTRAAPVMPGYPPRREFGFTPEKPSIAPIRPQPQKFSQPLPQSGPSPLPPLPEIKAEQKKQGLFSKLFKK